MKEIKIHIEPEKDTLLRVPFTQEERAKVDAYIKATGYKKGEWYRRALLAAAGVTQEASHANP